MVLATPFVGSDYTLALTVGYSWSILMPSHKFLYHWASS